MVCTLNLLNAGSGHFQEVSWDVLCCVVPVIP